MEKDKIKSTNKTIIGIISSLLLYTFLLILPFLILPLAFTQLPFTGITLKVISFIYSIFSGIIAIYHYQRIEKDKIKF